MKKRSCPMCEKGELVHVDDIISEIEGYFFIEEGTRCTYCSEEFISEYIGQKTINVARRLGIWGQPLKLHRKLSRSARGTVLRIPEDIKEHMNLKGNENIFISSIGKKRLMIEIIK